MHELSIAQGIVTLVDEAARGRRIARVNVEIGAMSGVAPDAVAFSFDLVTQGTCAEGAKLNIIEIPATARCEDCGLEFPMHRSLYRMLLRLLSQDAAARRRA